MEKVVSFLKTFVRGFKRRLNFEFTSMTTVLFLYVITRITTEGLEEFLILPTAWYYIDQLGETELFLGATLAAYSVGAVIFAPFMGALDDRFRSTKSILVFSAVVKFLGHLIYSIPVSAYFPLFGRFISGIAGSSVGVVYGVVSRYTDRENRAKAFLFFAGLFEFGTTLAPTIGSFLTFDANFLGWRIGPGNSPSFILATIWFVMIFASVFGLPKDLGREEFLPLEEIHIQSGTKDDDKRNPEAMPKTNDPTMVTIDSKIACLYFIIFMVYVFNCIVGFYTPLFAVELYHLKLIHVKVLFLKGSLAIFVGFFINYLASECAPERSLVVVWVALQIVPVLLLFYFAITWSNANPIIGSYLLLPLNCLGLPVFGYSITLSLVSKVTDLNRAAFYLALGYTVSHLSAVIGRLIAGLTFNQTSIMYTCTGLFFFWIVQVAWFSFEYRKFPAV